MLKIFPSYLTRRRLVWRFRRAVTQYICNPLRWVADALDEKTAHARHDDIIWIALAKIPGGYNYDGVASTQLCFPLKAGGELRFMRADDDINDELTIDLYDGMLPPGITGFVQETGQGD